MALTYILIFQMQVVPNIAMAETYCRLLLIAPHSLFRSHFNVIFLTSNVASASVIILFCMLFENMNALYNAFPQEYLNFVV